MTDRERNESASPLSNPMQPVMEVLQGADRNSVCARYGISPDDLEQRTSQYQDLMRKRALADNLSAAKVGRNDPCPCGSGKKYKKCCMARHQEARRQMPRERVRELEDKTRAREKLEKEVARGFDLLLSQDYGKALRFAEALLEKYPEDDRLHDIAVSTWLATGDYDQAFYRARSRWQVAAEERGYYQENGIHRREVDNPAALVNFYAPATWLEKFWIAQRARVYREQFPVGGDPGLAEKVARLLAANDLKRFPQRDEAGVTARREALAPVLADLAAAGGGAIGHLLPLTYHFSWAALFIPELVDGYDTPDSVRLLAELSLFRFPYFAQLCLTRLEQRGAAALPAIREVLTEHTAFDELKVGLLMVLGTIRTQESFEILVAFSEHQNPYLVNWAAQALGRQQNPAALEVLERARARLGKLSKIQGAIEDLARLKASATPL